MKTGTDDGVEVTINLDIPIGAGLGSSAAVTVATILSSSTINNIKLTMDEIAKLAHQVELEVQGCSKSNRHHPKHPWWNYLPFKEC